MPKAITESPQIPGRLLRRLAEVCADVEQLHGELEDFLLSRNPKLLRKLRKARHDDLTGKTRSYDELTRDLGLLR